MIGFAAWFAATAPATMLPHEFRYGSRSSNHWRRGDLTKVCSLEFRGVAEGTPPKMLSLELWGSEATETAVPPKK